MVHFLTDLVSWLAMTGPTMPGMVAKVLVIPRRIPAYLQTQVHCLLNSSHFGADPATASFKCQAWIYIKTRIHILRSTQYCVYSEQTEWIRSFSFLRGSDVQVVDVETGRRHSAQRGGDCEERHSQDVVTACVTSRHEKTRWPDHA